MMSVLLSGMTLFFAWRGSTDWVTSVWAAGGFASIYWMRQAPAIVYLGTSAVDAEYTTPGSYPLGIASQYFIEAVILLLVAMASWTTMRGRHSGIRFQGSKH